MADTGNGKPPVDKAFHPVPGQAVLLTAALQDLRPQPTDFLAEGCYRRPIHRHPIIANMPHEDRSQISTLFWYRIVHAPPKFSVNLLQLCLPPFAHRLTEHRELSLPGLCADMRKTKEMEGLRLSPPAPLSVRPRKSAKLDQAGLVGVKFQPKLGKPLAKLGKKPLRLDPMLKPNNEVMG